MRCPECGTQAADNAAFCPKCDHILDPSLFLDDLPSEGPVDATNPGVQHKPKAPSSSSSDARPAGRRKPSRQRPQASKKTPAENTPGVDATGKTSPVQEEAGQQWFPERSEKGEFGEAEMLLNSLKDDFMAQSAADKLMLVGALGMLLSCFFPWQYLEHSGAILGFLSPGVLIVLMAIGSVLGMLWRKRTHESFPLLPWLLQGFSGLLAVVFCLVLAKMFWLTKSAAELMGAHVESSTPSLGLFLGLLFAILNLAGTGLGLKQD